jgi:hypothetical protein
MIFGKAKPPSTVSGMPSTTANLVALAVITLSIVASSFNVKLGADVYLMLYFVIFATAKVTNGWFASDKYLGWTAVNVLSLARLRRASRRFALYIWHPAIAYLFATILYWLGLAAVLWMAVTLWQGLYFETAALIALSIFVPGTISAMYPDLYFVDAADRGNKTAAKMLSDLRDAQQTLSRDHRFAPHLTLFPKPESPSGKPNINSGPPPIRKPFHLNASRKERQRWLAHTPPWDRLASSVIDAILDRITDKVLLEAFVLHSTQEGLTSRYEALGRENEDPEIICAQISRILCEKGNQIIASLEKALLAGKLDEAAEMASRAECLFEPAIALAKNQFMAYVSLAHLNGRAGKRQECHDWAERGLVELQEMRSDFAQMGIKPFQGSTVIPPDTLDQMEKYLRGLLEY